jgi:hypothetical protein
MEEEVVTSVRQVQDLCKDLRGKCASRTKDQVTLPITHTLNRHMILTFANRPVHTKKVIKSGSAKRNFSPIAKLFLSLQFRPGDVDMEEFFCYENQREPTNLSNQGSQRSGNKANIL